LCLHSTLLRTMRTMRTTRTMRTMFAQSLVITTPHFPPYTPNTISILDIYPNENLLL